MKTQTTFADWDFDAIWRINSEINNGYPHLRAFFESVSIPCEAYYEHNENYKCVPITYTITYDLDGGIISSANPASYTVETSVFTLSNPSKTGYTFAGWTGANGATPQTTVSIALGSFGNKNYTANWTLNTYTVTFIDHDGMELSQQTVNHGSAAIAPATAPTRAGHTFTGWDVEFGNVTSDLTVTALYTDDLQPTYTVTFVDWNGAVLKTQIVNENTAAIAPTAPTREGYTFIGWDVNFNNVTSNLTVMAVYEITSYTVTFVDWNSTILKTQTVNHGSSATAPTTPTRVGYTFSGWDKAFSNVTDDLTVTALYTDDSQPTYTVTFADWNGTVLKTQIVNENTAAIAPTAPTREGYAFTGWDKTFSNVTGDLTVTAQYIKTHTVTFVDWDGTVLETQTVNESSSAIAPTAPIRTDYTFTGWDVEFDNVTRNLTVMAVYEAITPTLPPQIATNNHLTQTQNALNLTTKTNATIELYNLSGNLISRQNYTAGNHSISLSHLPKGMYIVKASFGSGKEVLRVAVR